MSGQPDRSRAASGRLAATASRVRWGPLIGLALATALAGTTWLAYRGDDRPAATAELPPHTPDYTISGFTASTMDTSGRLRRRMQAEHLAHYPDDGVTELTAPRLVFFRGKAPPWRVDAGSGRVTAEGDRVDLAGGVRMVRPEGDGEVTLVTEALEVRPDAEYAQTDRPVTLTAPGAEVHGVGMEAYLKEQRLVLLNDVEGRYEAR